MKRVLVISNNCFSKSNSNGRTLGNLFFHYEKDKIAQFYLSGEPDESMCNHYFRVSDQDVIHSVFPFYKKKMNQGKNNPASAMKKTVAKMMIRNTLWNLGFWKNKSLKAWLNQFQPEVIVFQVGDCAFLMRFVLSVAKHYHAKIVNYNSEAYYFKDFNYLRDGHNHLYSLWLKNYRKTFRKLMKQSASNVYLCDKLAKDYQEAFPSSQSYVIYNSALTAPKPRQEKENYPIRVNYLGNLGLGRVDSLIDVADALNKIDGNLNLGVYGKIDESVIQSLKENPNIDYHGVIPYEETLKVISDSSIVLHVESFDSFYAEDSKYGFSGKIADNLASGKPFLLYAPEHIACAEYLKATHAALVVSDKKDLVEALKSLLYDENIRKEFVKNALEIFKNNHDLNKNSDDFITILNQ